MNKPLNDILSRIDAALDAWQHTHEGGRADMLYLGLKEVRLLDETFGYIVFVYRDMEIAVSGLSGIKIGRKYD